MTRQHTFGLACALMLGACLWTSFEADAQDRAAAPQVRLSTVIIYTARFERLADFYARALDFPAPDTVLDNHIGYWLGDNYVAFEPPEDGHEPATGAVRAWFGVSDIEAAYARLLEHGATARSSPERQPWGDVHATVLDPEGNVLGLIQSVEVR